MKLNSRKWCAEVIIIFLVYCCGISSQQKSGAGSGNDGNLRVCVVEGKGLYKKAGRFCPILDKSGSGVECVIGNDRLDCLRRISKGSVDFGVFSSEDLLAARWQNIEVLVTDELRFHNEPFEYQVVAIIDERSGIKDVHDLQGSRLCHPGYGYEADWTDTLANFLESKVIPRSCDPSLSLFENKLRASAEFFSLACKAGPWVADRARDRVLKSLYPSLCSLCYDPLTCSTGDKYWGRRGPLHCLTEEAGDVAWARYDDTRIHFGITGRKGIADPTNYSFLCVDGTKQPVANNTSPCVWIAKPWPVIAAKLKSSAAVSQLSRTLSHQDVLSWQSALLSLIELYHANVTPLKPQVPVQDYLKKAIGFQSANSFAECTPPRSIMICTNSIVSRHKCDWLAETAKAHGLEPHLQCLARIGNTNDTSVSSRINQDNLCFDAINKGEAEVTIGHPNLQVEAYQDFKLEPVLFEMTPIMNDLYIVVAVVKKNSTIKTIEDFRGKKACFPKYNGVAWHAVIHFLKTQKLFQTNECPFEKELDAFFASYCAPGLPSELCGYHNDYEGETGALKCLVDGIADIAFVGMNTVNNISDAIGVESWSHKVKSGDFRKVCPPKNSQGCFISWSSIGQMYIRSNTTVMRKQELINTFKQLDQMFGRNYKSQTSAFMMYSSFDHKNNILFQDRTKYLRTLDDLLENRLPFNYEVMMNEYKFGECEIGSFGNILKIDKSLMYMFFVYLLFIYNTRENVFLY